MTKMTTEEAFVKVLQMHGIEHAFGIIGSAFMPIPDLFPKAGITFWDVAHETNGGYVCDGYTRSTGKIAMAILGAMEVAENGDLANWMVPGKLVKGMGGAMDLVAGVGRVVVVMDHTSKHGESKLLKECTLPLTGAGVVDRVITNLGVLDVVEGGLKIVELADGVSKEELVAATEATIVG